MADLEECDSSAVAHAEQKEADKNGDGRPECIQLPVLGLSTDIIQFCVWTERAVSVSPNKMGIRPFPCGGSLHGGPGESCSLTGPADPPWGHFSFL